MLFASPTRPRSPYANQQLVLDPDQPLSFGSWFSSVLASATPVRTPATDRNRTALRKGMVCRDGDMPRHDNIPGRARWMVPGHVHQPACWKGLGLDWRRSRGVLGTAAASKSSHVPYAIDGLPGPVRPLQLVHAEILHLHCT